jgi:hypothetical protein
MSLGLTSYSSARLLDKSLGQTDFTPAATHYFGLFTTNPTDAAGTGYTELSDGGYARVSKTNNTTTWANWTSGAKKCQVEVVFGAATEDWTEVNGVGIWDASSSGNLEAWGALTNPRLILDTETLTIAANSGQITFLGDAGGNGGVTDYAAGKMMDHQFGATDYTEMATCYFGLLTVNPGTDGSGDTEMTGTGYARDDITNDTSLWPGWSGGVTATGAAVAFTAGEDWAEAPGGGIWDDASSGNLWFWGKLTTPKTILNGATETFPAGSITAWIQ